MKASDFNSEKFFLQIMPRLRDFGRYAAAIQKSIKTFEKIDPSIDPAVAVVTDGDHIVQEGLLRAIFYELGYSDISVGVEEGFRMKKGLERLEGVEESSPYSELFNKKSQIRLEIDPIDGTSAYKKEINNWCIVLSLYKNGLLDGTMVHTPWDGNIYFATTEKERAQVCDKFNRVKDFRIRLKPEFELVTMTHFLDKKKQKEIEQVGIEVNQVNEEGRAGRYPFVGLNGIYRGELAAWFKESAPARDWGSMSLIVEKAGGIVTDYSGKRVDIHNYFNRHRGELNGCLPSIVVSTNPAVHESLVKILGEE